MDEKSKPSSHIQHGTVAQGILRSESNIRIDGILEGTADAKGCVSIGEKGSLKGTIHTKEARIDGHVRGSIEASGGVFLSKTCFVECDVSAVNLIVQPGGRLQGNFVITPNPEEHKQFGKQGKSDKDELVLKDVSVTVLLPNASQVRLIGNFFNWDHSKAIPFSRREGGRWSAQFRLKPGSYEYLLLVDGKSQIDPTNPQKVTNSYGGENSVLIVPKN